MDAVAAHELSQGLGVTVAVVDSGVELHPDLRSNVLPGTNVLGTAGSDGHTDSTGHGTGMAGIIAAHGDGSAGALGLAPKAKILPVAAGLGDSPKGQDAVAEGIAWATTHGAEVINVSGGGNPSDRLRAAVEAAVDADVVVVAAAGNQPRSNVGFPAAYPGVLAVGATDHNGDIAAISATGESVALTAPGEDIMTTRLGGAYGAGTGTSDAAAIVSGAVALVRSRFPELSAAEVVHRLTATATDKGPPGRDDQYGFGVLNIVAALTADVPPLSQATPSPPQPTSSVAAPPRDSDRPPWVGVLVAVAGVITAFVLILRARRHRRERGTVA
ncbi:type VII secretion-associated serine protease mycosin [Asanoa sp. WMMD1127]|uniref:type VII secretion-associated serine protease mycosin n=1 Tax=Asanoa sp. WMMD1127 TaxID=3016107 RepID=UPI002415A101|nr:type VII secretion-associated serine protease mycosin [Asanoa sp. WMMD1127]MDG4822830.1 type VII secretion-associated serine protease mycosin [Asanoa sp. WMMD1127]